MPAVRRAGVPAKSPRVPIGFRNETRSQNQPLPTAGRGREGFSARALRRMSCARQDARVAVARPERDAILSRAPENPQFGTEFGSVDYGDDLSLPHRIADVQPRGASTRRKPWDTDRQPGTATPSPAGSWSGERPTSSLRRWTRSPIRPGPESSPPSGEPSPRSRPESARGLGPTGPLSTTRRPSAATSGSRPGTWPRRRRSLGASRRLWLGGLLRQRAARAAARTAATSIAALVVGSHGGERKARRDKMERMDAIMAVLGAGRTSRPPRRYRPARSEP